MTGDAHGLVCISCLLFRAVIIELKRNDCAESAIDQIRQKQYDDSLEHYRGDLLFMGIDCQGKQLFHDSKADGRLNFSLKGDNCGLQEKYSMSTVGNISR